jgi:hypothetical protein
MLYRDLTFLGFRGEGQPAAGTAGQDTVVGHAAIMQPFEEYEEKKRMLEAE